LNKNTKSAPVVPSNIQRTLNLPTFFCHKGTHKIFTSGNLTVHAGGLNRDVKLWPEALWLNCTGSRVGGPPFEIYGFTPQIFRTAVQREIVIDWPDYSTPEMARNFWNTLQQEFTLMAAPGPLDVIVFCDGGHGRTGTALAVLLALYGITNTPIAFVRDTYCEFAIETIKQEYYVNRVTGLAEALPVYDAPVTPTRQWDDVYRRQKAVAYVPCHVCKGWTAQSALVDGVCSECTHKFDVSAGIPTDNRDWEVCDVCQTQFLYDASCVIGTSVLCPTCVLAIE
jgi:hypothetical protein